MRTSRGRVSEDYSHFHIDVNGVHWIGELMVSIPNVIRRLNKKGNTIQDGEDELLCLLHVLCSNHWLVEVELFACDLRINAENGPVLVKMLHKNLEREYELVWFMFTPSLNPQPSPHTCRACAN